MRERRKGDIRTPVAIRTKKHPMSSILTIEPIYEVSGHWGSSVGQNVTWSGGFPRSMSPCFHYGRRIKFKTTIYSLRVFFAKTARTILMTQNKGWNLSWRSLIHQTSSLLIVVTNWTLAWSNPCDIGFVLIIFSISDFLWVFRSLALNSYVTWYTTSANRRRRFVFISSKYSTGILGVLVVNSSSW
jgi:hypothetical protein